MFEKIPLNDIYVADYVDETLEYVYGSIYKQTTIIHHFDVKKNKSIFIWMADQNGKFAGYLNLLDQKIYKPITTSLNDYEEVYDSFNLGVGNTNDGYINFEPLKNFSSRYIKPYMSIKLVKKALLDINRQREKEKVKSLIFKN